MKAKTHNNSGTYDFISGLIEVNDFDFSQGSDDTFLFEKVLSFNFSGRVSFEDYQKQSDFRRLYFTLLHESVHFFDLNSTMYGLEFFYRRLRVFSDIYESRSFNDSIGVFLINYSELSIHNKHVDFDLESSGIGLMDFDFRHFLLYDQKHGGIINFSFFENEEQKSTVPLSMLSMIECHAVAMEFLSKIKFAEMIENQICRTIELKSIDRELYFFLNNCKDVNIEYKVYLCLFFKIFKSRSLEGEIGSKRILRGFCYLLNKILDTSGMGLASFASKRWFRDDFSKINFVVAENILLDMQRGLARHIFLFKLIIFFDGVFDDFVDIFKVDEIKCINDFFDLILEFEYESSFLDIELSLQNKLFDDFCCSSSEFSYWKRIHEICLINRAFLRDRNYLDFSLSEMGCIGFSDCLGGFVNCCDVMDFEGFFKRNQVVFDEFSKGFYGLNLRRNHVDLGGHINWISILDPKILDIIKNQDEL